MDGLLERVCWIAAYCASLAGQRASERLLLQRVKAEIDAIEAQLIAEGKPMQWVGYENESPVPAGMEKGKAR